MILAITAMGCAGAKRPSALAPEAPNTDAILRLIGRFNVAHACPISESLALTNAHVTDLRHGVIGAGPYSLGWSNAEGHNGILSPLGTYTYRDLAVMESDRPFARWYKIAAEPPSPGDRLLTIGYEWRRERDVFDTRLFTPELRRIVARHLIFAPGTEKGASGACILNARGEVVGINAWGIPSEDGGHGGGAPGVWGESFERN